jgi:hypothetical protein
MTAAHVFQKLSHLRVVAGIVHMEVLVGFRKHRQAVHEGVERIGACLSLVALGDKECIDLRRQIEDE